MLKKTLTRRSRLGFGYETAAEQCESGLSVIATTKPYHTGTYQQIQDALDVDKEWQLINSGGTYFTKAWFVRARGRWRKVPREQAFYPEMLSHCDRVDVWYE